MNNKIKNGVQTIYNTLFVLVACFCVIIFLGGGKVFANNESVQFAEGVNLALRRTAHHLLIANGDSSSAIPAVQQSDANTFMIRMDHLFDYDKLPALLQQSLDLHHIKRTYNVSILDCETGALQLGYNFADLSPKNGVPCGGRKRNPGCYNLKITFEPQKQVVGAQSNWWIVPFGSVLVLLGFIVWKKNRQEHNAEKEAPSDANKLSFGGSELDISNLILTSKNTSHSLTYREAKLLKLFATNTNQVLDRDFILKSVWQDEGITVGRSVDVFVSRLRKMLAADPQVKITAVHGIGYRMDILS